MKQNSQIFSFLFKMSFMIFTIIFLIYPMAFIFKRNSYLVWVVAIIIFLSAYFLGKKLEELDISIKLKRYIPWILFIIAFLIRFIWVNYAHLNVAQLSDFGRVFARAISGDFLAVNEHGVVIDNYYLMAPHYVLYPYLLHQIFRIFPSTIFTIGMVNVIAQSFTTMFIYLIIRKLSGNWKSSIVFALLYALWPSAVVYTIIASPDHIGSLLIIISIYLLLKLLDNTTTRNKIVTFALPLGIGALLGLNDLFKPFSIILIIALKIKIKEIFDIKFLSNIAKTVLSAGILLIIIKILYYIMKNNAVESGMFKNILIAGVIVITGVCSYIGINMIFRTNETKEIVKILKLNKGIDYEKNNKL